MLQAILEGLLVGAGLIIAIGAQNAYVLKQGIRKRHLLITALFCSLSDALLITAGVLGMGTLFDNFPAIIKVVAFIGSAYIFYFAFHSLVAVCKGGHLEVDSKETQKAWKLITTLAVLTFLNPHVYIDTVIMLGGIAASKALQERIYFAIGSVSASFFWFFGLTYGAAMLAPLFKKEISWKILNSLIACLMAYIAVKLLIFAIGL